MSERGLTLIEVLASAVIASVVAGGTMMAFITAARIQALQTNPHLAEADGLAEQTAERLRNLVAADLTLPTGGWQSDPISGGGTESISAMGAVRRYRITPSDCDGDGIVAGGGEQDCYAVNVRVCWDGTPCP